MSYWNTVFVVLSIYLIFVCGFQTIYSNDTHIITNNSNSTTQIIKHSVNKNSNANLHFLLSIVKILKIEGDPCNRTEKLDYLEKCKKIMNNL